MFEILWTKTTHEDYLRKPLLDKESLKATMGFNPYSAIALFVRVSKDAYAPPRPCGGAVKLR